MKPLAAGAVTDAKTQARRAGDEGCIGQGRGAARGMLWHLCMLVSVGFRSMHLVSEWMTQVLGSGDCTSVRDAILVARGFRSLWGSYAGVLNRVAGVEGAQEVLAPSSLSL